MYGLTYMDLTQRISPRQDWPCFVCGSKWFNEACLNISSRNCSSLPNLVISMGKSRAPECSCFMLLTHTLHARLRSDSRLCSKLSHSQHYLPISIFSTFSSTCISRIHHVCDSGFCNTSRSETSLCHLSARNLNRQCPSSRPSFHCSPF